MTTEKTTAGALILNPVCDDVAVKETFDRYQRLKSVLLDDSDYTHFVRWARDESKPSTRGFPTAAEANAHAEKMRKSFPLVSQERRIKKSGVLKLSKAFAISTTVVTHQLEWGTAAYYRIRSVAPNGQQHERTGICDRKERGRSDSPYDHIDAIAMTRATNRAIMALLGGEVTAEEIDETVETVEKKTPKAKENSSAPAPAKRPEEMTKEELSREFDNAFKAAWAATPPTKKALIKALFASADRAGVDKEKLRADVRESYKVESTTSLSETQLKEVIAALDSLPPKKKGGDAEKKS